MEKAKALWHLSGVRSAIGPAALAEPAGSSSLLIRTIYSLVSIGTERLVATGSVPAEVGAAMRAPFMEGDFSFPVKYGYSLVGEVVEGPHEWPGRRVHLMHPHQDWCRVPPEAVTLLPPGLPPDRAALAANMETALNAVWDAELGAGDRVLVVGYGLIGALTAHLAAAYPAVEVQVAEVDENRKILAQKHGFPGLDPADAQPFDLAFHTSGTAEGLQYCLDAVGLEGKVVELSWYGTKAVSLQLGADFHHLRKRIISSQVSRIPVGKSGRWDFARRKATVLRLLADPVWDRLLTHRVPFGALPEFFGAIREGQPESFCGLVVY